MLELLPLYFLAGVTAGTLGAMLGLGGGVVLVPFLSAFLGVEPIFSVIAISLLCNVAVSTSATVHFARFGMVQWSVCRVLLPASVVGILSGYAIATSMPQDAVKVAFGGYVFFSIAMMFRGGLREPEPKRRTPARAPSTAVLGVVGWGMGLVGPILGIGGGIIATPAQKMLGVPMRNVVANTLATMTVSSALGAMLYFTLGQAIFPPAEALGVAVLVLPGSILGAQFGARLCRVLPAHYVKAVFAVVAAYMAYRMLASGLGWG